MSGRADVRRTVPWVLCVISLGMLIASNWLRWLLRNDVSFDDVGWLSGTISALGFAGIPLVGALIASRLPGNLYGWLWCAAGLSYGVSDLATPLVRVVGGPVWVSGLLTAWGFAISLGLLVLMFLLFPTGRLPTHRWRWLARAAVAGSLLLVLAVPFAFAEDGPTAGNPWAVQGSVGRYLALTAEAGVFVMFGLVLVGMFSLVPRFRRAGPVERRQLAWFLYAAALIGLYLVLDAFGLIPVSPIGAAVGAAAIALLPIAVGVAVLKYRLFEIDRIVSRTVSYGLLSAGLIGLYLLVVALLRPLLEPFTGSSTLAVAGSTLAVAAVFNPARRRLQEVVDRRFDRARYDAARAVDAFSARLRSEVDLDEITERLCDTITATVAPGKVTVWLRPAGQRKG
jgi:hypothetical protein